MKNKENIDTQNNEELQTSSEQYENDFIITGEDLAQAKEGLSEHLHTTWREGIQAGFEENGQDPDSERLRPSKDKSGEMDAAWFQEQEANGVEFPLDDNGNKLVNTNVAYENLPPSWQQANIGAAEFVTGNVADRLNNGQELNNDMIEQASSDVHDKWMEDNEWQRETNPELFVDYSELTEEEKTKDRDQVLATIAIFTNRY